MEDKEKKLALQKAVGERVYHSRKLARMSKEELAERLGISSQYVNDIEQGKKCMSMAIFVELGEVFHTGLDELAHGAQKEEPVLEHLLCDSLPDLFHSLCLEPRERAAADYLRGMGASGLGVEAAARTAAVLSTGAEGAIPLKEGYAAAMAAQNTSYACVEKNIRSMVGKLQAGACGEYQALMGGLPAERPSNELFLRRLARRILEW